jgi:hypothetical protein
MNWKPTSFLTAFALLAVCSAPLAAQSLRGSPASVNRIYDQAVRHGLPFYKNASAIRSSVERGELVRLEGNANYALSNVSYPYVLPELNTFVERIAAQYRSACGEKLVVTSSVRPTTMRLANSVDKSVHPTGMAVDLRKPSDSRCLSWLRNTLSTLEAAGVLDAVEERNPPHFHVAVFPSQYARYVGVRSNSGGQLVSAARPSLATAARSASSGAASSGSSSQAQTYRVRSGDTLWTIARRNNLTVDGLKAANNLQTSRIIAGQVLRIPAK